ncbi:helix-turn-helix domain-containing protein [Nucisporomicrobium flavum]|uniref:helix-turn-helix domain-containing protein n=1 Tax=Nucisporomicrobium flavum TaxID=2785915 RepID=UPI001F2C679F|nr:helix-turn-helix transcriptional regulator [Nucisporomicrobium flavum]
MRLREARHAKHWSQARLVREIEEHARRHGLDVAAKSSLHVYVSEWENGRRPLSPKYAAILRALLGWTDAELRGEDASSAGTLVDGYEELLQRIESARTVGSSIVQTVTQQTELLRTMDRQVGAAALVDQVHAHLGHLQEALAFAVLPDARRPLALALAEAASMAAWQALDVGAADRAWRHYELAKSAAREAESSLHLAHAMGEQAYVLADAGKPDLAAQLIAEAQRVGGRALSPRLGSWLHAAQAEVYALAGMPDECRKALDRASAALPAGPQDRDADLRSVFLNEVHLTRWRGHSLALLGDEGAMAELQAALDAMDGTFIRAQAGLRCGLAQAHLVRRELDQARIQLRQARSLATQTGSIRHRQRVERLMQRM